MPNAPVLTASTSGRVPRVDVKAPSFPASTSYFNVFRTVDGRQMQVQGGVRVGAVVNVVVPDEQAAFGPSSYKLEFFTAGDVSLGFSDSTSVTLSVTDVWVQQPLDPSLAVNLGPYGFLGSSIPSLLRPFDSATVYTENAAVGRVVAGRRQGLRGVQVDLATDTLEQADELQAIFGTYDTPQLPVACIRTPPGIRLPRVLFLHAPDGPQESSVNVQWGGTRVNWFMTGDEVAPPNPGLTVPLLTYTDLDVSYATYTARDAAYASYSAQDSDFSLAGAAGGL